MCNALRTIHKGNIMKVIISLSAKATEEFDSKKFVAQFKPKVKAYAADLKARLSKIGTVTGGTPDAGVFNNNTNKAQFESRYSLKVDGLSCTVRVLFYIPQKAAKLSDAKMLAYFKCDKKGINKTVVNAAVVTAAQLAKIVSDNVGVAAKKKDRDVTPAEKMAEKMAAPAIEKAQARLAQLRKDNKLIDAKLPAGLKMKIYKTNHLGIPSAISFVDAESSKCGGLAIWLEDDGKFSCSVRLKGFLGSMAETWPCKYKGKYALTEENLSKVLKGMGFIA